MRPRNWPVRWRLAGVSAGLTLAILVLFGVIIGELASQRVRADFNREVKGAATTLASNVYIETTITNELLIQSPRLSDFTKANGASARILDSSGNPFEPIPGSAALGPPNPGLHTVGEMRVATVALRSSPNGPIVGYVQYGRDEEHIDSTIGRLWLFIAAGIFVATLLASLAGLAIARRAMRPISSLTTTARAIAETGDPSRHMPALRADDEIGELAGTLEQMLRSLDRARSEREAAMRKQREFVADASHELRTPLTSILANLELLQASLDEAGHEDEHAMLSSALRSSNRMSRLVGDLLLLARADAGRTGVRTSCDLAHAAREAAIEAAPLMAGRQLRTDDTMALPVDGNPDELHRMVVNLLENAARHTPAGSTIELRLRAERGDAVVEVSDDGPGIPAEMREQIFDRFVRGDGPADTAARGGSGLGLAIVRAVATSHGGSAEVAESESGGALFRIRIPLSDTSGKITAALDRV